ncbi:MAG TPA: MMPL family transporter [Candidatus Lachnoclostridium stercoripullorum]|uniref:MMPL family transporter n=1 Tax=Candidatus Lachnoclostridium stercoripullorum TaxID=2838635 RepID=A0A9D1W221_9FIRM|nr:MMPL family transporter [Candidatus Lachnoclostridium stercoripullorum]
MKFPHFHFQKKRFQGENFQKKKFDLPDFIIRKSRAIEKVFIVMVLISAVMAPFVEVNYDLTEYLPDSVESRQGLNIMEDTFGYPGTARVMIKDVTLYEAKAYKDRLEKVDGVDRILWLDTGTNVFSGEGFIDYTSIDQYYKDDCAVMDVIFEEGDTSKKTSAAIDDMKEITGEKGCYVGMAVQDKSVAKNVRSEMQMILVIGVFMIFLVLCLTTNSWVEPFLYLTVMGVAVVINKGTNLFLGEISFLTNSVSAVLQLAVSMDYSIFLIHAFTRYKKAGMGQTEALRAAIDEALNSIFASSLTTIVGFIVLVFMRFSIGYDMGIVLAKGIVCSLLTVVLFMPAMIIRLAGWMERTAHRPFLPEFDRLSRGIYRVRYLVLAIVAVLALPAYTAQGMNSYMYGNDAVGAGEGTEVYADEQEIDRIFGRSNMMMALVPSGDNVREREFSQELSDLPYTKTVMSLSQTLPEGVPESFLPESVTGLLHDESGWSRILIYVRSKGESEAAFRYADEISAIMKEYYPGESYLVGATPSTQDIKATITEDYSRVNTLSLIGVFVVVMFSFKSILIPLIAMIPIEVAIFINMAVPYIAGETMIFMGYIIVSSIQLGATVDYAILTTNNYIACRKTMEKEAAAVETLKRSIPSILTSGSILTIVGYILYHISSIAAIGDMGHLIGRGAILSMLLVCTFMPALLVLGDRVLMNNEVEMIRQYLKRRRERRREKLRQVIGAAAASGREEKDNEK